MSIRLYILLIILCQSAHADMIPCLKWRDVTQADLAEMIPSIIFEDRNRIHGMVGKVSEEPSKKCLQKYNLTTGYSKIGYANLFSKPKQVTDALCKAVFVTENLSDGKWTLHKDRGYAVALKREDSCDIRPAAEFITLSKEIEDKTAELILKNSQSIYQEYLLLEKESVNGMKFSAIGLETTEALNTYFVFAYTGSCSTLNLLVRLNEKQQLEYVGHNWILC